MKVATITVKLSPDADAHTDKELEAIIRFYLDPSDIPFGEKIEKVKVLSQSMSRNLINPSRDY